MSKTVRLSPAQAVIMAKIQDEAAKLETVDGWAPIDHIVYSENYRSFSVLVRKGYLESKYNPSSGPPYSYAKILKGP